MKNLATIINQTKRHILFLCFFLSYSVFAETITLPLSLSSNSDSPAGAVSRGIAALCPTFSDVASADDIGQQQLLSVCTRIADTQASSTEISNALEQMSARAITSLIHYTARTPIAGDFGRTSSFSQKQKYKFIPETNGFVKTPSTLRMNPFSLVNNGGNWLKNINVYASVNAVSLEQNRTFSDANFSGSSLGMILGADTVVFKKLEMGLALNISKANFDVLQATQLDTSRQSLIGYTSVSITNNWFVEAVGSASNLNYDLTRPVLFTIAGQDFNETATSGSSGKQLNASAGTGYDVSLPFGASLVAWADVNAMRTKLDKFQESNGNGFNLEIDAINIYVGQWRVGLDVTKPLYQSWGIIVPQLSALYITEFYNKGRPVNTQFVNDPTNSSFGFISDDRDASYLDLSAGVAFIFQRNISAYINYRRYLLLDSYTHAVASTGFRMEF